MAEKAFSLFLANYSWLNPIRSIGLRGCDLVAPGTHEQLSLFEDEKKHIIQEKIEITVDALRSRFGHFSVQRAILLKDVALGSINPKEDHIIHPISFFKEGKLP